MVARGNFILTCYIEDGVSLGFVCTNVEALDLVAGDGHASRRSHSLCALHEKSRPNARVVHVGVGGSATVSSRHGSLLWHGRLRGAGVRGVSHRRRPGSSDAVHKQHHSRNARCGFVSFQQRSFASVRRRIVHEINALPTVSAAGYHVCVSSRRVPHVPVKVFNN